MGEVRNNIAINESVDDLLNRVINNKNYKFPITSSKTNLMNKKIDFKVLMLMTLLSNKQREDEFMASGEEELWRYVYRNKLIEHVELVESLSKSKIQSIIKIINKMSKLDCNVVNVRKTEQNEIIYDINYTANGKEFVTIETRVMEALIHSFNSTTIKIYILLKYMCRNGKRQITQSWLLNQIGLSDKSHNNYKMLLDITTELHCGGYINRETITTESKQRITYYEINTIDEWMRIRKAGRKNK